MARYENGWYDYQMVKINNNVEIGQILDVNRSGSQTLYYVEGDHGTKDWFFGDELTKCAQDKNGRILI